MLFTVGNMKVCLLLKFLLLLNGNSEVNRSSRILDYDCGSDMTELDSDKLTQGKKFQRGAQASIRRIAHCGLMSLRSHSNSFLHLLSFSNYFWLTECYLDCGTPASIVFLMGVHILPFFEKAVGRKAHINLYLL
ncbi:hypothetical protein F383_34477 [Gossypium arboreum]|uniref:Uncharacterized protein n=1 Tax=Gossypium arboreum TaxID=29729 RepID=A0A0B0N4L1_GOSAR|nr:hypothetical protein F383_34477 [Gossypium arboreum]